MEINKNQHQQSICRYSKPKLFQGSGQRTSCSSPTTLVYNLVNTKPTQTHKINLHATEIISEELENCTTNFASKYTLFSLKSILISLMGISVKWCLEAQQIWSAVAGRKVKQFFAPGHISIIISLLCHTLLMNHIALK